MTKKDYELIAEGVRRGYEMEVSENLLGLAIIQQLSMTLGRENLRFDAEKFKKACGLDK